MPSTDLSLSSAHLVTDFSSQWYELLFHTLPSPFRLFTLLTSFIGIAFCWARAYYYFANSASFFLASSKIYFFYSPVYSYAACAFFLASSLIAASYFSLISSASFCLIALDRPWKVLKMASFISLLRIFLTFDTKSDDFSYVISMLTSSSSWLNSCTLTLPLHVSDGSATDFASK